MRNALAGAGGQLFPLAAFFLAAPYLLRGLGPSSFGVLTLFLAAAAIVASVDFGLGAGGVRSLGAALYADSPAEFRNGMREWWSAYLLISLLFALLSLIISPWAGKAIQMHLAMEPSTGKVALYAFGITVIASYCSNACQLVARTHEQFTGLTLVQAAGGLSLWLGLAIVVYTGGGINSALIWVAVNTILTFIGHALWAWRLSGGWNLIPSFSFPRIRQSRAYCLHVFWGQLAGNATYQADKFIVSHNLGTALTGQYGLITNIASKLLMLVATVASFVFPRAVRLHSTDEREGVELTYLRASRYVLLVSWPIFALMMALTPPFLHLWLGNDAAEVLTLPMVILLVAYFINSLSVVASNIFNGLGDARIGARFSSASGLLAVTGCLLLTSLAGLTGAAIAALLASMQVFFYTHRLHIRLQLGRFPLARLWSKLAIAVLPSLLLVELGVWSGLPYTWAGLFVSGAASLLLFYGIWFLAGYADDGDKQLLRRLITGMSNHINT